LPNDTAPTQLLHQHHTVLILRLTLDQQEQLYRGTVIDPDEQVVGQFRNWQDTRHFAGTMAERQADRFVDLVTGLVGLDLHALGWTSKT